MLSIALKLLYWRLPIRVVVLVLLASIPAGLVSAEHVASMTLRILDASYGTPIPRVWVALMTPSPSDGKVKFLSQGRTNREGLIVFNLPQTLPERITLSFSPDEIKPCSNLTFQTEEVLRKGIVANNQCSGTAANVSSEVKKGQIQIFATKVSLLERMRRELP